ncbi:MAG: hypothetical protein KDI07_11410 [Anaerolineae bacterium]|nr:hypothetical protein [Anaerolineae bacterium]MCB9130531.1 hypothetical protein [Anaerolineales bacterium]MCB0231396.1 hypothetical protein [Anaerolineae bacterium]MCB0234857.1 hypothetical protein [Anaerolineae bacterium]MCB0237769.1 hypothetical protein [Anaerolineae bacterium]
MNRRQSSHRLVGLLFVALLALPALACGRTAEIATPSAAPALPTPTTASAEATSVVTTPSQSEVVITEADIEEGARSVTLDGATIDGLDVEFAQDQMTLRAAQLSYGVLSLRDVVVEGTLRAEGGVPVFDATRIEPSSFATNLIPPLINQFLGMLANDWHVEDLRVEPGQLVLLVRPT